MKYIFLLLALLSVNIYAENLPEAKISYEELGKVDNFLFSNNDNKKYEILYFFSYSCSACFQFSDVFNQWFKINKSAEVDIRKIPVIFREHWFFTSKLHFIANGLKIKNLDDTIYKYIHVDKQYIVSDEDIFKFFKTVYQISEDKVKPYINNPELIFTTEQAMKIADKFEIPATPYFVVIDSDKNAFKVSHRYSISDLGVISTLNYLTKPNFILLFIN